MAVNDRARPSTGSAVRSVEHSVMSIWLMVSALNIALPLYMVLIIKALSYLKGKHFCSIVTIIYRVISVENILNILLTNTYIEWSLLEAVQDNLTNFKRI